MKRTFLVVLLLTAILFGAFAGGSDEKATTASGEERIKETVVIGNIRDITMVNPYGSNTTENLNMFQMTHSRLLKINPVTYELENDLAVEYSISADGLEYVFKIREGVTFHNGDILNADDVLYSFGLAKESSFTSSKLKWIEKMEKLDDYTVKFTLSKPFQDMIYGFAYPNICIVDEEAIAKDPDTGYKIGSGAYAIENWILGDYTKLVRNENYYGELPKTKVFIFRLIQEDSARVIALENGEIDICIQPPATQNSYIEGNSKLQLMKVVGNKLNYLALNLTKDMFQNQKVREAIAHAIDRDSIIAAATEGLGTPANTVLSPKTPYYNPSQNVLEYDLEKAKACLAEAGVKPSDLTFEIICNGSVRETVATVIQSDLKQIGVNVQVTNMEASALKSKLNAKGHDVVVYNWAPSPGEGICITMDSLFYSGSGSNRTIMADPYVDSTIDAAAVELDPAKRQQLYYDVQKYLVDYAAFIPMYYETITMGATKNLRGFVCDVAEQHTYTYAYVVE